MEIQWHNIAALGLMVLAVIIFVKNKTEIASFLVMANRIGSGTPEEQVIGLIAVSVMGILAIAVLRILIDSSRKDK